MHHQSCSHPDRAGLGQTAVGITVLVLATACGSSSGSGGSSSLTGAGPGEGLATTSTAVGTILTDGAGKSMYSFAADAKLGELTRDDGTKQLTVDGMPMYTYVGDSAKGDTNGQGLDQSGGLWSLVATNGSSITDGAPAS